MEVQKSFTIGSSNQTKVFADFATNCYPKRRKTPVKKLFEFLLFFAILRVILDFPGAQGSLISPLNVTQNPPDDKGTLTQTVSGWQFYKVEITKTCLQIIDWPKSLFNKIRGPKNETLVDKTYTSIFTDPDQFYVIDPPIARKSFKRRKIARKTASRRTFNSTGNFIL